MTHDERVQLVRATIKAMWLLDRNARCSEDDAVDRIVNQWEADVEDERWDAREEGRVEGENASLPGRSEGIDA